MRLAIAGNDAAEGLAVPLTRHLKGRLDMSPVSCPDAGGPNALSDRVAGPCSAERAAWSKDAQIITLGARVIGPDPAKTVADARIGGLGLSGAPVDATPALDRKSART